MTGDDDDRDVEFKLLYAAKEIDSRNLRHAHVGHDAAGFDLLQDTEKCLGRIETASLDTCRLEQEFERLPNGIIVIDYVDDRFRLHRRRLLLHLRPQA